MSENILAKLFEHNNWANQKIIQMCYDLSDQQLDTQPQSVTKGNIRETLLHLVSAQRGYFTLLTLPVDERPTAPLTFGELLESAQLSGDGLLALARGEKAAFDSRLRTRDGYLTEPWVVMLQAINHATEHREQIKSMLSAQGVTPPELDGWDYAIAVDALVPISA